MIGEQDTKHMTKKSGIYRNSGNELFTKWGNNNHNI